MLKRNVRILFEAKKKELDMNLANNYKDLAHDALKELDAMVMKFKEDKLINDKDYNKLSFIVSEYKTKMSHYHH